MYAGIVQPHDGKDLQRLPGDKLIEGFNYDLRCDRRRCGVIDQLPLATQETQHIQAPTMRVSRYFPRVPDRLQA